MRTELDFTDYHGNEEEDIRICLNTLYSTRQGSVALDRDFGINWDFVDEPIPVAINKLAIEVMAKTEKYEKRIKIKDVICTQDAETGQIIAKVVLKDG